MPSFSYQLEPIMNAVEWLELLEQITPHVVVIIAVDHMLNDNVWEGKGNLRRPQMLMAFPFWLDG